MLTGDVRVFLTENLHKNLERVINKLQGWRDVYYILVKVSDKYMGPHQTAKESRVINTENKRIIHNRFVVMEERPMIPFLSTMLWEINNKIGRAKCLYVLPPDKPMIDCELEGGSEIVFKSAQGMPLIFNRN